MSWPVFVDTSAWYAAADAGDSEHMAAVRRLTRLRRERRVLHTTNHVVAETYTLLRRRGGHAAAQAFLRRIRDDLLVRRTFVPEAWEVAAEDLLAQYDDQDFSYVDAISFVAMRRLGLEVAFAFDHHFTVAGFTLLTD